MSNQVKPPVSRRRFLTGAATAAAGAATLGFPMIAKAQGPISMRWQSTWPSKDIFHEFALDFAKKINDMTGSTSIFRSPCCRPAPWCLHSSCSTRSRRERSTAATACSSITTANRLRWRCGVLVRATPWTRTC